MFSVGLGDIYNIHNDIAGDITFLMCFLLVKDCVISLVSGLFRDT